MQLVQELCAAGLHAANAVTPKGDKIMRLVPQTAMIERGDVLLPRRAPWLAGYVAELTSSPKGKCDDHVDSTAQALKWIAESGIEPHMLTWIKQECARLHVAPSAP